MRSCATLCCKIIVKYSGLTVVVSGWCEIRLSHFVPHQSGIEMGVLTDTGFESFGPNQSGVMM